jgi:hypothetical protein
VSMPTGGPVLPDVDQFFPRAEPLGEPTDAP